MTTRRKAPSGIAVTVARDPAGVYLRKLSKRFVKQLNDETSVDEDRRQIVRQLQLTPNDP